MSFSSSPRAEPTSSAASPRCWTPSTRPTASWVAYPKQASKLETDLTFETVQEVGLANGLVDNKSCAIDDDWSAVRFVFSREDRPRR